MTSAQNAPFAIKLVGALVAVIVLALVIYVGAAISVYVLAFILQILGTIAG
jgi:hypothetical protein